MWNEQEEPLLNKRDEDVDISENEGAGCGSTLPCDPKRQLHKFLILIIMSFLTFGSYFCYDNPAALQDTMKRDMKLDTSQFLLFYSLYSWPNVILCFFGGYMIDSIFGLRWGAIIFSLFVAAGQIIFAFGAIFGHFWLMCVGRFVFGLGGESLSVAQNAYAVNWFIGRELNMVFGLQISFSRVGSTVNMYVMQPLYDAVSKTFSGHLALGLSLLIASGFCLFSLLCALALSYFQKRKNRILKVPERGTGEKIQFRDVLHFNMRFWFLCLICVAYYISIFPFIALGLVFFEMKWDLSPYDANAVNSCVYIISAVASPFFGFLIDRFGKNVFWVLTGILATLGCHALLAFTFVTPYVAMVLMGFAFSILAAALWPMVALIVPEHQVATAYGIMQAVQNLGLAVVGLVAGIIVDNSGYLILEMFFLGCLCVALIFGVLLFLSDSAKGGELNLSAWKRREVAAATAALCAPNHVIT